MGWEHVIPNFVSRLMNSQSQGQDEISFSIQGDGRQTRSFIYIDDFVDGLECLLNSGKHLNIYNIGTENEITIADLARQVAAQLGLTVRILSGPEAPGSTHRRCPDMAKLRALGFTPKTSWTDSLRATVEWYRQHPESRREQIQSNDQVFIR
jgi:nucleoside-diphosphate-sugar epimerase